MKILMIITKPNSMQQKQVKMDKINKLNKITNEEDRFRRKKQNKSKI